MQKFKTTQSYNQALLLLPEGQEKLAQPISVYMPNSTGFIRSSYLHSGRTRRK
jgi:hypothetical protein